MSVRNSLSSSTAYANGESSDGFRPKGVKKLETSSDYFSRTEESILVQPALYAGLGTMGVLATTQMAPEHFLPQRLLGRRLHGIGVQRFFAVPLCMTSCMFIGVADQLTDNKIMAGHFSGLFISVGSFALFCHLGKYSHVFPSIGLSYLFYGYTFHYMALKQSFDGMPIASISDVKEILSDVWRGESRRVANERTKLLEEERQRMLEMASAGRREL